VDPEQALRRIDDETISVTLRNVHQARQPSDR
jgi:hypothetical protein